MTAAQPEAPLVAGTERAGWRAVLRDHHEQIVWGCRHVHGHQQEAQSCADLELAAPGASELGERLRVLRREAGVTIEQAARHLECSDSSLSRVETGRVTAKIRDVRDLAALYGVPDAEAALLEEAAKAVRDARNALAAQRRQVTSQLRAAP